MGSLKNKKQIEMHVGYMLQRVKFLKMKFPVIL